MKVDCPTCDYEFETTTGLGCPRCGDQISCSSVGCSECDACSTSLSKVGTKIRSRISLGRIEYTTDDDR